MSYTQTCYHIVFSTKQRTPVLVAQSRELLFRYIWGVIKNLNSELYKINAVEDHIHILTSIHPTVSLADFVKQIKVSSSRRIKQDRLFPMFSGWQDGYAAFTHSRNDKRRLIHYIRTQQEHHKKETPQEELRRLLEEAGIQFDARYLS